ncbi:ENR1 protein, partial [Gymnorhina tibicen]|nr:ENR1 protein [Gymnorhina tibicen]
KEKQEKEDPLASGKNLFIDLAERISKQLNLTKYWVCGGTLESENWPWRGINIGPLELIKLNYLTTQTRKDLEEWQLSGSVIGDECIWHKG